MESPLVWQFKIPQAEQQTFGDALPAQPALHSLSVGAMKSSFMENQINETFHTCTGIISIPSHHSQGNLSTGESLCSCQNVLSRPCLPLNAKRLMRLQATDAPPTLISRRNNSYHKMDLNIYKMVNTAANT